MLQVLVLRIMMRVLDIWPFDRDPWTCAGAMSSFCVEVKHMSQYSHFVINMPAYVESSRSTFYMSCPRRHEMPADNTKQYDNTAASMRSVLSVVWIRHA